MRVIDLTTQIGQARGELIAREHQQLDSVRPRRIGRGRGGCAQGASEAVKVIGARRFIPLFNDVIARIRLDAGDRNGALRAAREAGASAARWASLLPGRWCLARWRLATGDAERRLEALRQGEAILQDGCASHNHFRFYRDAIEVSLREGICGSRGDLCGHVGALLRRGRFAVVGLHRAARGRALAAGGGAAGRMRTLVAELRRLRDHAADAGMLAAVPRLDQALRDA